MKRLILILIFGTFLYSQTAIACCAGDYIGLFPRGFNISSNATFLIDFAEHDFALKNKISDLVFTAITTKGKCFKLTVLETNFSGTMGQVFLKVKSNLKLGDTIFIHVSLLNDDTLSGKIKKFASIISFRKWVVKFQTDNEIPAWASDTISYSTDDSRNSSAPGYSINFNPKVTDNSITSDNYKLSGKLSLPFFYEVTLGNQKFICSADGSNPGIYSSICGSNFIFEIDKSYSATVKIIDASGNFALQEKTFVFKTIGYNQEIRILNSNDCYH